MVTARLKTKVLKQRSQEGLGLGHGWSMAHHARSRVREAHVVALEWGGTEDFVNVTKGVHADS